MTTVHLLGSVNLDQYILVILFCLVQGQGVVWEGLFCLTVILDVFYISFSVVEVGCIQENLDIISGLVLASTFDIFLVPILFNDSYTICFFHVGRGISRWGGPEGQLPFLVWSLVVES